MLRKLNMSDVKPLTIGDKVKKLREMKGWSQQQLAEKCGFSVSFISKLETNSKKYLNPTYSTFVALASALGVETSELLPKNEPAPFSETLQHVRKKKAFSIKKLSNESGISEKDLIAYESGTKFPSRDSMHQLAKVLEKTFDQLIFNRPKDRESASRSIPEIVISPAQGGKQFDDEGHLQTKGDYKSFPHCPPDIKDPFAYAVRITLEDASEPFLREGSRLICTINEEPKEKDLVILLTNEGGMTGGELSYDNNKIIIRPFNPKESLETYSRKDIKAIHPVVWIRRK